MMEFIRAYSGNPEVITMIEEAAEKGLIISIIRVDLLSEALLRCLVYKITESIGSK